MKKVFLLLASAALLIVGCNKEQLSNGEDGGMITATFTANLESGVATRAVADGDGAAANVNRCIMEIYYGDALYARQISKVTDKQATFNAQVVSNRGYTVAFWADCVDDTTTVNGLAADKYYNTASLKEITFKSSYVGNEDARDAFFVCEPFTVQQTGGSFSATLKRPFAQMNVITTDWDKVTTVETLKPEKVNVTLKNAMVVFNAVTGEASGSQDITYEAAVYTAPAPVAPVSETDKTLSMDYLFASATKGVIDIDWKALHGTDTDVEHTFAAVPYQRNFRTNIKGALLTTQGKWTVTVVPTWSAPDYDVPFLAASTIAEAQSYIAPTESGTQKSKVVDLSKAIITTSDITGEDKKIEFRLKTTSPVDMVNFTLPAIPEDVIDAGCTGWKITYEEGYPTKNVNVTAPEGTNVTIEAPKSHVTLNGTEYEQVTASTGPSTLVVPAGVTVKNLIVKEGGVEIHGCVEIVSVTGTAETVFVRECENLTQAVYDNLKDYIAPNYTGVQNTDGSWNIELEDFWPNFAAAEFSAIDQSGKTLTISTPAELALLAKNINAGTSYAGYTISISGNLDMSAHYWIPINAYNGYLSGATINGAGNAVISNLKIEKAAYQGNYSYYAGFIAQTVGALTIKNLTFSSAVSVDNGSGVATVLGETYGNALFENVKVVNSTVAAVTKAGALVGFSGGDGVTITVRNCSLENVTVKAEYSYALMVGLVNVNDHVVFEGNNTTVNSHAVLDEELASTDLPGRKTIKGYEYGVDGTKLWVVGVQDAWAECRTSPTPTKTIDDVDYSVMGDIFYHADGVVVDVCAPDPVAQIGDAKYATLDEAFTAVQEGQTIEIIQAGTYTLPSPINNITIKGVDGVVFNAMKPYGQSVSLLHNVAFESVKFIFGNEHYTGFQHSESVTFTKCTFEGYFNSYGTMLFDQCTFNSPEGNYSMWCYAGNVTYKNCTINCKGKFVNAYNEGNALNDGEGNCIPWKIVAEGCTFNSTTKNKAAFNIKATCGSKPLYYDVEIKNCTANGENWPATSTSESLVVGSALWQVDDINASVTSNIKVTVDDTVVYPIPAI